MDDNIVVKASAGSGKTTVMIDQILYLMHMVLELSEIFVIMFTNPKDKYLYTNKRFLITEDTVNEQEIMARIMAYLGKFYVDILVRADIFKFAGGGQNYIHGGTPL